MRLTASAALLLVLVGCPTTDPVADSETPEERVFTVAVELAESGIVAEPVQVTGTLKPRRDVVVSAEGNGRVVEVLAALGDAVDAGAVLARLDSAVQRANLDNARAGLRRAKAMLALSEAGMKRAETLIASGATTTVDHFRAGVDLETARAGVDAAAAQVALAERALADTAVRAPFAGTIAGKHIELGALVGPGTPAFRLVDMTRVVVSVGIPAREIRRVAKGQPVSIQVPALGAQVDGGIVAHLGPEPDPRTRTYPAEIEVPDPDGALRSGMVARVDIVVGERDSVLIPEEAVIDEEPPHVFVIEDGVARKREVLLGRLSRGRYEARSGVNAGDHLATFGKQHLSDGVKVEPYDLPEATAEGRSSGAAEQLTP